MCQAKGKERQWVRHQMHGELDESKLVEGLTGEKGIYKRRADREPEVCSALTRPCSYTETLLLLGFLETLVILSISNYSWIKKRQHFSSIRSRVTRPKSSRCH